jgi:hypothetical protein
MQAAREEQNEWDLNRNPETDYLGSTVHTSWREMLMGTKRRHTLQYSAQFVKHETGTV